MKTYHDIVGDGGSNVIGQVEALQAAIREALSGVRRVVAVASGKGGVGKSTLTAALARRLMQNGRVTILDADLNGPCQARMAGLEGAPWVPGDGGLLLPRTQDDLGVLSFGSWLDEGRPVEIPSVAPNEEHTWRATRELATLRQLLASVEWGELDALVVDLPPGTDRTQHYAAVLQEMGPPVSFVLVTIPSAVSRDVVSRSVSGLRDQGFDVLGYVENMAGYYCHDCDEIRPLFPPSADPVDLDLPRLASVPFDPELARHCDHGWPADTADPPGLAALDPLVDKILNLEPQA